MVLANRSALLAVLVCLTVLLAGCSGWGTDGPADDGPELDESDDLEEAGGTDETGNGDETDGASADEGGDGGEAEQTDGGSEESGTNGDGDDRGDGDEVEGSTDEGEEQSTDDDTDVDGETEDTEESGDESADDQPEAPPSGSDDGTAAADEPNDESPPDGEDGDEPETHTLTVETEDVVTGEPVDADVIRLRQDGETIEETSGGSATFEGIENGEYGLEIYDDLGDWVYADTVTIDGGDATYVADIDQEHTYWPGVEVTVVDGDGEPVEGETVTINGQDHETGPDGTATDEIESSYTDEREFVVEYGDQSETVEVDWETWDGEPETVTFEAGDGGEGDDVETAASTIAA